MKLNNISLTHQGRGEQILLILTGAPEAVQLAQNSLVNFGGVSDEAQFEEFPIKQNEDEPLRVMFEVWSSRKAFRSYLLTRLYHAANEKFNAWQDRAFTEARKTMHRKEAKRVAESYAMGRLQKIATWQASRFFAAPVIGQRLFRKRRISDIEPEAFSLASACAERPDEREENETAAMTRAGMMEGYESATMPKQSSSEELDSKELTM